MNTDTLRSDNPKLQRNARYALRQPSSVSATMKLITATALLGTLVASTSAFSPSPISGSKVLRDLELISMAPPGGRGGAAEPEYSNSGELKAADIVAACSQWICVYKTARPVQ
jgi:hypothetical protein